MKVLGMKVANRVCQVPFSRGSRHAGGGVADVAADAVALHGVDDVPRAVDEREPGGLAVHARAQGADDGVGAGHGSVDRGRVGDLTDDHVHVLTPGGGHLVGIADVGGDGVSFRQELVDDLLADRAGGSEDGDVHLLTAPDRSWCIATNGESFPFV
jgi:hypothetical protein